MSLAKEIQSINKQLGAISPVVSVATYLGVSPVVAAGLVTVAMFVSFMLFFSIGTNFIYTVTGFGYPTYATYKLVESKADFSAIKGCMAYWTVFGLFTLMEVVIDALLSWVPLYSIARVGFQAWLFAHNFAGSIVVYNAAVIPIMSTADALVAQVSKELAAMKLAAK